MVLIVAALLVTAVIALSGDENLQIPDPQPTEALVAPGA
jgi:hypothetical protein